MKENNSTKKEAKSSLLNDVRGEYRKIIWPSRREQIKQTKIVVVVSAMLGLLIMSYDFVFGFLMDLLAKLFV